MDESTACAAPGKACTKCGQWKTLDQYHRHPRTKDRRASWCKTCVIAMGKAQVDAKRDDPTWRAYMAAHQRLRAQRGRAGDLTCVRCGAQAEEWSYRHDDPAELASCVGPYSEDVSRYDPMCRSCHRRKDWARV